MDAKKLHWFKQRERTPEKITLARKILEEVRAGRSVAESIRRFPLENGGYVGKHMLVSVYRQLLESGEWTEDERLLQRIRMKPVRTLSGVTTVTALTKPYPCPGKCIFCPTDVRMPKSYLPDEPGARRGLDHDFDPFAQVRSRLEALEAVGHPTQKIELLILGGTWSAYRKDYQEWFVKRCFDALNQVELETLEEAQKYNETALHRCVGLVIETRPDNIHRSVLRWLRYLGVTKIQIGVQSLNDQILALNQRGHDVADVRRAVQLVRAAGFKIVLHWMPNLLGATLESDRHDFNQLWEELCPDEIKIYPTQLLENADLYQFWLAGKYQPYSTQELVNLIADVKTTIPRYCRVNRVIRDIPSTYVVEGNKRTSLRQDIQNEMRRRGTKCQCIRCREIRAQKVNLAKLSLHHLSYSAGAFSESFISFVTDNDQIAGFLRLSLPGLGAPETSISDLNSAAIIREVHVYGQSIQLGEDGSRAAQHQGLGTRLIREAESIAQKQGFSRLAVIAAVGTRRYYRRLGFKNGELYMIKELGGEKTIMQKKVDRG